MSGMRSAGQIACVASAAPSISSWAPFENKPLLPKNPSDEDVPPRALIGLINELMVGVETLSGIKPGSWVEQQLVRISGSPQAMEARKWGASDVIAKPSVAMRLDLNAQKGPSIVSAARRVLGLWAQV